MKKRTSKYTLWLVITIILLVAAICGSLLYGMKWEEKEIEAQIGPVSTTDAQEKDDSKLKPFIDRMITRLKEMKGGIEK